MAPELKAKLKAIAAEGCWELEEDEVVEDYAGGNVDDAFQGGERVGRVHLARDLLAEFGGG